MSAWGVESGVSKSYIPGKGFVSASTVPKKELYAVAYKHQHWRKAGGRYMKRAPVSIDRGRNTSALTSGDHVLGASRAHGGKRTPNEWAVNPSLKGQLKIETIAHERAHADPKRSAWRLKQIHSDPAKSAREEARAEMAAGHHYAGSQKAHSSYVHQARTQPNSPFSTEFRATQDKIAAGRKK
jgi:hypothetical protein